MDKKDTKVIDKKRRNFLKLLAVGGGTLVVGKIFSGTILDLIYGPAKTQDFQQFSVTEKRGRFSIAAKDGEEVFVMDNEK